MGRISSKKSGVVADTHKKLDNMEGLADKTESNIDENSSSDDDVDDMNTNDQTDSDEGDEDMDIGGAVSDSEEENEVSGEEEENEDSDGDEEESEDSDGDEEEEVKDNVRDSSDEDESRTAEDGDGVDFSDSDDNDAEGDGDKQNTEDTDGDDIKVAANPAWAQAMAKILRTQKPSGKKAVVLSKARTIQAAESAAVNKEEEPDFEIVGETEGKPKVKSEDVKPTVEELHEAKRKRLAQCRVKQEDFDYNRERALTKIATKGVVQLFNAVRSQQKNLGSKLAEAHSTRMEEKLLKSIDKDAFLEHLTGKIRSRPVETVEKAIKKEEGEIVLPKSWDELSKKVESSSWDKVIEIKDEPED